PPVRALGRRSASRVVSHGSDPLGDSDQRAARLRVCTLAAGRRAAVWSTASLNGARRRCRESEARPLAGARRGARRSGHRQFAAQRGRVQPVDLSRLRATVIDWIHAFGRDDAVVHLQGDGAQTLRRQVGNWTYLTAGDGAEDAFRLCFRLYPPNDMAPTETA